MLEVVNPVLIFMSYQQAFDTKLLLGLGLSVGLAFLSYGFTILLVDLLYRKNKTDEGAVEKFASVYSNCGFMGIPLINGLFGAEGVFYLTGYVTVFNIMVWTHGVISFGGRGQKTSVKKVLSSPAIIATLLGLVTFLLRPVLGCDCGGECCAFGSGLCGRYEHSSCYALCRRYHKRNGHRGAYRKCGDIPCGVSQAYCLPCFVLARFQVVPYPSYSIYGGAGGGGLSCGGYGNDVRYKIQKMPRKGGCDLCGDDTAFGCDAPAYGYVRLGVMIWI